MAPHMDNRQLYCVITDVNGKQVTSDIVTVTLPDNALKLLAQPQNVTVGSDSRFTVSLEVSGEGLSYQWYCKDQKTNIFCPSSTKTAAYTGSMEPYVDNFQLYCIITDAFGNEVRTKVITVTRK